MAATCRRFLKAEIKRADVTYAELVERLKEHGLKMRRPQLQEAETGDVYSDILLACVAALELEGVGLDEI